MAPRMTPQTVQNLKKYFSNTSGNRCEKQPRFLLLLVPPKQAEAEAEEEEEEEEEEAEEETEF